MPTHTFTDLDRAVDALHAVADGWNAECAMVEALGTDGLHVLRLTVHEWIANLVQHASFPEDAEIVLTTAVDGDVVRCAVEDTSSGFDFAAQIESQRSILDAPAPSERGRGLLMLVSCAEDLDFRPAADGVRQRLAFSMRDPAGGDLGALFRPADLELDPDLARSMGDGHISAAPASAPSPRHP
jgi:serine/threonine-protein kinase RsbW